MDLKGRTLRQSSSGDTPVSSFPSLLKSSTSFVQMIRKNIAPVVPGVVPDVEALISEILHRMLQREQPAAPTSRGGGTPSSRTLTSTPSPAFARPYVEQGARAVSPSQHYRNSPTQGRQAALPYRVHTPHDPFISATPPSFPNDYGPGSSRTSGPPSGTYPGHGPPMNPYLSSKAIHRESA